MRTLGYALIVVSMTLMSWLAMEPAEATRPVPGYPYKDVCKNIPGKQYSYDTVGTGRYRFDTTTKRPNDCIRVWVKKG